MPNNRVKTTKALQSKKGKAVLSKLHPHSRRAKQLTRIALREDRLTANKKERKKFSSAMTSRLIWFTEAASLASTLGLTKETAGEESGGSTGSQTLEAMHILIDRFIHRNSAQIDEENAKRKPKNAQMTRPKSSTQEKLEILRKAELQEYSSDGFVIPDLTLAENISLLLHWKTQTRCDPSFLPRLRLIRLFKNDPNLLIEEQQGAYGTFMSQTDFSLNNNNNSDDDDEGEDVNLIEVDE